MQCVAAGMCVCLCEVGVWGVWVCLGGVGVGVGLGVYVWVYMFVLGGGRSVGVWGGAHCILLMQVWGCLWKSVQCVCVLSCVCVSN